MSWKQVKKNKAKQKEYIKRVEAERDRLYDENNDLKVENANLMDFVQNLITGLHMINELAAALGQGTCLVSSTKGEDGRYKFVAVEADPEDIADDEKEDDGQRDGN